MHVNIYMCVYVCILIIYVCANWCWIKDRDREGNNEKPNRAIEIPVAKITLGETRKERELLGQVLFIMWHRHFQQRNWLLLLDFWYLEKQHSVNKQVCIRDTQLHHWFLFQTEVTCKPQMIDNCSGKKTFHFKKYLKIIADSNT